MSHLTFEELALRQRCGIAHTLLDMGRAAARAALKDVRIGDRHQVGPYLTDAVGEFIGSDAGRGGGLERRVHGQVLSQAGRKANPACRLRRSAHALLVLLLVACGKSSVSAPPPGAPRATVLNASLSSPWGLAFLPDARMLVTQKGGTMLILSANGARVEATVSGVPAVVDSGQGGLLDVALDPDFDAQSNPWIYWSYAEAGSGGTGTAVARGRLVGAALQDVAVIFRQLPKLSGGAHFGSRLAFRADKTLFVTLGERMRDDPFSPGLQYAQNVATHLGKVVRIHRDGSTPADNPQLGIPGALPQLWSYGHRNPQGAAIHPATGELWVSEHGPQGGDELNRVLAGGNYGWPIRSYGCPYGMPVGDACRVGGGTHAPSYVEPVSFWVPTSIAPAGLMFYTGERFPDWRGSAFTGALAGKALWRVALNGNAQASREALFADPGERIRDVRQGPDGWIYLLTDSGKLIRIER